MTLLFSDRIIEPQFEIRSIHYTKIMSEALSWDATYAIAIALKRQFPDAKLDNVSLNQIYRWTIGLPEFSDDPAIATERILAEIYQLWFEENIHDDK